MDKKTCSGKCSYKIIIIIMMMMMITIIIIKYHWKSSLISRAIR